MTTNHSPQSRARALLALPPVACDDDDTRDERADEAYALISELADIGDVESADLVWRLRDAISPYNGQRTF